jgi:galactosyltransferase
VLLIIAVLFFVQKCRHLLERRPFGRYRMSRSRSKVITILLTVLIILAFFYYHHHVSTLSNGSNQSWLQRGISHLENTQKPIWVIATSSPAHSLQRRQIIRLTWQTLFRNHSLFTTRFFISNPTALWETCIAQENATHGDIIILKDLEESPTIANTVKSIEFLKYLTSQAKDHQWRFVSKIDDDSFIDPNAFYHKYLVPILNSKTQAPTILGRELYSGAFRFPGGQFYTMTWPLAEKLSTLHRQNPITDELEDVLVGRLLFEAQEEWTLITLPNSVAFDYNDDLGQVINGKKTAWAKENADLDVWVHAVGPGAINPHKMRRDEEYLRVAACYDQNGLKNPEA